MCRREIVNAARRSPPSGKRPRIASARPRGLKSKPRLKRPMTVRVEPTKTPKISRIREAKHGEAKRHEPDRPPKKPPKLGNHVPPTRSPRVDSRQSAVVVVSVEDLVSKLAQAAQLSM